MPRTSLPPRIFFKKMKKKPALQAILDNIDNYSVEELENVKGQPLWIRKVLVQIKKEKEAPKEFKSDDIAITLAMKMDPDFTKENPTRIYEKYEVKRWVGGTWFMPSGTTGEFKTEINPNDYFLIYSPGRAKIQSSISNMNEQQWNYFQNNTEYVGYMDITEFARFVSEQLTNKHGEVESTIVKSEDPSIKDMGLFKIYRR